MWHTNIINWNAPVEHKIEYCVHKGCQESSLHYLRTSYHHALRSLLDSPIFLALLSFAEDGVHLAQNYTRRRSSRNYSWLIAFTLCNIPGFHRSSTSPSRRGSFVIFRYIIIDLCTSKNIPEINALEITCAGVNNHNIESSTERDVKIGSRSKVRLSLNGENKNINKLWHRKKNSRFWTFSKVIFLIHG